MHIFDPLSWKYCQIIDKRSTQILGYIKEQLGQTLPGTESLTQPTRCFMEHLPTGSGSIHY